MGLLKPTGGCASIFGLDCSQYAAEIAKKAGYLPSENCYYNNLSKMFLLNDTGMLFRDLKHYSDLCDQGNSTMEEWIQRELRDNFILQRRSF